MRSTSRAFAAPWQYVQGPGEIKNLPELCRRYSDKVLAVVDGFLFDTLGGQLKKSFAETDTALCLDRFGGECTEKEIARVQALARELGVGVVMAVGGGKTQDTVKAAAMSMDSMHVIIVPTSVSGDGPVASVAVVYTEEGVHDHSFNFPRGADLVLIDSEIILNAPRRLLVAGMGDALSTCYEARACDRNVVKNGVGKGYLPCKAGLAIAELCYDILMRDSEMALLAKDTGDINEAFENIIEANSLLSGLGFQNTGCCLCHSTNAGLSELPGAAPYLHGERVAFGVLVQLAFENAPMDEIRHILKYMDMVGLPMTLADVGVEATAENIDVMTKKMVYENALAHTNPLVVNEQTVSSAIIMADALGRAYREGKI